MYRGRKVIAVLMVVIWSFGAMIGVHADDIEDKKAEGEALEAEKAEAEAEKAELDRQLSEIIQNMKETEEALVKKQDEIKVTQDKLVAARIQADDQYESMKKRIQFMYENGQVEFFEIICSAHSMADLINKADYVSQISEADRDLLNEYKETVKRIQDHEAALAKEEAELKVLQDELISQQAQVEDLLASKNIEISNLEDAIGQNAQELATLIAEAEAAKKRQEEAARLAAAGGGGSAGSPVISGSGQLSHPCPQGRLTSGYGYRDAPTAGATSYHAGIDFGAPSGSAVYAADGGTVVTAQFNSARGYYIVVNHGNGMQTWYQHLSAMYVGVGSSVSRGDNIGAVGTTGISTGPHLHFEVHVNGSPVNPAYYL